MAMHPCKSCKEPVSGSAKACPHCGAANPSVTGTQAFLGALLVLGAIVVGVLVYNRLANQPANDLQTRVGNAFTTPEMREQAAKANRNERFVAGPFQIRVGETWRQTHGDAIDTNARENKSTEGQHLFIAFTIYNLDDAPQSTPDLRLVDASGAVYEPSAVDLAPRLNPSVSENAVASFHAPPWRGYDLKIDDALVVIEEKKNP